MRRHGSFGEANSGNGRRAVTSNIGPEPTANTCGCSLRRRRWPRFARETDPTSVCRSVEREGDSALGGAHPENWGRIEAIRPQPPATRPGAYRAEFGVLIISINDEVISLDEPLPGKQKISPRPQSLIHHHLKRCRRDRAKKSYRLCCKLLFVIRKQMR